MIPQSVRDQIRKDAEEKYQYGRHLGPLLEGRDRADVDRSRQAHIEAAEAMWIKCNRWIPVGEKMPEKGVTVLVWDPREDADHEPGSTMDALDPDSDGYTWIEHSNSYEHYLACSGEVPSVGPPKEAPYTHWKPLPPSPHD